MLRKAVATPRHVIERLVGHRVRTSVVSFAKAPVWTVEDLMPSAALADPEGNEFDVIAG